MAHGNGGRSSSGRATAVPGEVNDDQVKRNAGKIVEYLLLRTVAMTMPWQISKLPVQVSVAEGLILGFGI